MKRCRDVLEEASDAMQCTCQLNDVPKRDKWCMCKVRFLLRKTQTNPTAPRPDLQGRNGREVIG